MFRTVLQSAADLLISMLAGGKHTEIKEDAGPYNGANDNLKHLDKPEFRKRIVTVGFADYFQSFCEAKYIRFAFCVYRLAFSVLRFAFIV